MARRVWFSEVYAERVKWEKNGGKAAAPLPHHLLLHKMGPQHDQVAYLELFERSTEVSNWPRDVWAARFIPLLSGEAQLAAQQLLVQDLLVYVDLKKTILQRVSLSAEQQR